MSLPQNKPALKLDWCSREAAKYAVEHWHYSGSLPSADLVKIGVWENDKFIGCIIFSRGANCNIGSPFGLKQQQICELTRVALTTHDTPVSRILSIAVKFLRVRCPGTRGVVSYADIDQNHHGGIYQAFGMTYFGRCKENERGAFIVKGKKTHPRVIGAIDGGVQSLDWIQSHLDPNATEFISRGKHKYFLPLDDAMRAQVAPLAKPYPKRICAASIDSDATGFQPEEGGAHPTAALKSADLL